MRRLPGISPVLRGTEHEEDAGQEDGGGIDAAAVGEASVGQLEDEEEGVPVEEEEDEEEEWSDDEDRHQSMLADVSAAVSGPSGHRRAAALLNEVYPESEYNLQPSIASAGQKNFPI